MPGLRRSTRISESSGKPSEAKAGPPTKKARTKTKDSGDNVKEIEIGDKVPDIRLLDENEEEVSLKDAASKSKYLVIFAYPKASTPGCTRQACGFQKNFSFLRDHDTTVLGLSNDAPKSLRSFANKQGLEYTLLSDPSRKLIGLLGAKKSPSGTKRSHWVFVDGTLKIKRIQISPEESVNSAKAEIEKFINEEKEKSRGGENEEEEHKPDVENDHEHDGTIGLKDLEAEKPEKSEKESKDDDEAKDGLKKEGEEKNQEGQNADLAEHNQVNENPEAN